jgi:hypothetical protein
MIMFALQHDGVLLEFGTDTLDTKSNISRWQPFDEVVRISRASKISMHSCHTLNLKNLTR